MPLAEVGGGIAGLLENPGGRRRLRIEPVGHVPGAIGLPRGQIGIDLPAGRVLARHHRDARGRADGRVDVEIGQPHAFLGQPVDMRRLHLRISETARVGIAHVVDEDEKDIGPFPWRRPDPRRSWQCGQGQQACSGASQEVSAVHRRSFLSWPNPLPAIVAWPGPVVQATLRRRTLSEGPPRAIIEPVRYLMDVR